MDSTQPAFTVEPRAGVDAAKVTLSVTNRDVVAGETTFTLAATWKGTPVTGVTKDNIATKLNVPDVTFAVDYAEPSGGYQLPIAGTTKLGGGAEMIAAEKATATILTS